jgi:hypothetical protein
LSIEVYVWVGRDFLFEQLVSGSIRIILQGWLVIVLWVVGARLSRLLYGGDS